ncbi:hypothetical protein M0R45_015255 [Rubus argutus]|uniref:Uncharacterized protein n=1 Tax=Rubus argutus TaxID=59490 RepID=A0AAW1XP48_RUBAR
MRKKNLLPSQAAIEPLLDPFGPLRPVKPSAATTQLDPFRRRPQAPPSSSKHPDQRRAIQDAVAAAALKQLAALSCSVRR